LCVIIVLMKLGKFLSVFVLSAIAVFALFELLFALNKENSSIKDDISYFTSPQNLEKELRGEFNYKKPGEKMIIIVPESSQ
jgi:hypothetical protein